MLDSDCWQQSLEHRGGCGGAVVSGWAVELLLKLEPVIRRERSGQQEVLQDGV